MTQQEQAFWRWTEFHWHDPQLDWRAAKHVTVGVDVGSISSQAVVLADGELFAFNNIRTGANSADSAWKALHGAFDGTGMTLDDVQYTVGTGYGRTNVPFADRAVTEIACHARGAVRMAGPQVRTILDMGGQDCKAIHCDADGKVSNFLMNDRCAAGTGRAVEVMADLLGVPIQEIGDRSFDVAAEPEPLSSKCVVFARSEASALLQSGRSSGQVLAAYCQAMAARAATQLERLGMEREFFITGGIAKNRGIVDRLCTRLGVIPLRSEFDPQIAGALGAALFADGIVRKGR